MSSQQDAEGERTLRRLERRELHRSRSVSASIALAASTLVAGTLATVAMLGRAGALSLPQPDDATTSIGAVTVRDPQSVLALGMTVGAWLWIAVGVLALGLTWLLLAVTRGRRARHALRRDDLVVIVDDAVLASAISREAAVGADVRHGGVRTAVSAHAAAVELRPSPGNRPDVASAGTAARRAVDALSLTHPMRTHVRVLEARS